MDHWPEPRQTNDTQSLSNVSRINDAVDDSYLVEIVSYLESQTDGYAWGREILDEIEHTGKVETGLNALIDAGLISVSEEDEGLLFGFPESMEDADPMDPDAGYSSPLYEMQSTHW